MGSLILCHKKHARQPYVIARGHIRIYTLEELCYFICNNLDRLYTDQQTAV